MNPLIDTWQANLLIAIGKSSFTQKIIQRIAEYDAYARQLLEFGDDSVGVDKSRVRWRTPRDNVRFRMYQKWHDLYLNEQEKWLCPDWLPTGKRFYKRYNFCRFVTQVFTDLLLGGGVEIHVGNSAVDNYINNVMCLPDYFYDWAQKASVFGFCPLQIVCDGNGVDIISVDPSHIFWKWRDCTDDELDWVAKKTFISLDKLKTNREIDLDVGGRYTVTGGVFEERHYIGYIEYYFYLVDGDYIVKVLDPRCYIKGLPELNEDGICLFETGVNEFMLQLIPNTVFMREFYSDYRDIEDLQRSINLRATQRGRILNIHADPKLMVPDTMQQRDPYTGELVVRSLRDEVIFLEPGDNFFKPEYLTWNAQLDAVERELDFDLRMLCTLAEISPTLIVNTDTTFPESAAAYKMKLTPTLNKVKRKERDFTKWMKRFLWVYIKKLYEENVFSMVSDTAIDSGNNIKTSADKNSVVDISVGEFLRYIKPSDIHLRFYPSLPQDERVLLERLGGLQSVSRHRVMKEVDGMSERQIESELELIREDQHQKDEVVYGSSGDGNMAPINTNPLTNDNPTKADILNSLNEPNSALMDIGVAPDVGGR